MITESNLKDLKTAGTLAAQFRKELAHIIANNLATAAQCEAHLANLIAKHGLYSGTVGYHGYKWNSCISTNSAFAHVPPIKTTPWVAGDLVKIDLVVGLNGMLVDTATTVEVNATDYIYDETTAELYLLLNRVFSFLETELRTKKSVPVDDLTKFIESGIRKLGLYPIKGVSGHGINPGLHEAPSIPNILGKSVNGAIERGKTYAIEPLVTDSPTTALTVSPADGWSILGIPSSAKYWHVEHTVYITNDGKVIQLT